MSLKNNKFFRRLAAALMAGTMMVSMFGMTAFAEENPITGLTIKKTVNAEDNVLMPNTSFSFTVTAKMVGEGTTVEGGGNTEFPVNRGVEWGVYFGEKNDKQETGTVTFAPGDDKEETVQLNFDVSVFSKAGVYRYEVSEDIFDVSGVNDGITKDSKVYTLDLWVTEENGTREIAGVVVYTLNDEGTLVKVGREGMIEFTNSYATNDLSLTKVVTGDQGDKGASFKFKIKITGADGEQFATDYNTAEGTLTLTSGTQQEITLGHDETIHIYGLSAGDTYEIVETDLEAGYTTTITGADSEDGLKATGNVADGDDNIVYTNERNASIPTGVVLNVAPYVAMVALAGVLAFVFLRRRNNNF